MRTVYNKLDAALGEVISALESEERSAGASSNENATIQKFKIWKSDLQIIRHSGRAQLTEREGCGEHQEGGLFAD